MHLRFWGGIFFIALQSKSAVQPAVLAYIHLENLPE